MSLIDDLQWRYACKKFDASKKLSESQIAQLIEALNLTPTSKGLQAFKFVVVEHTANKEKLLEAAYFQQQVVDCSHLIVICREKIVQPALIDDFFERTVLLRDLDKNAPHILRFQKGLRSTLDLEDVHLDHWITNQIYLVMGNLLTACAVMRIDACPMEGFDKVLLADQLQLEAYNLLPVLLCPVGFRHESDVFQHYKKVRRPLEEMFIKF
jgi:nitroreductase